MTDRIGLIRTARTTRLYGPHTGLPYTDLPAPCDDVVVNREVILTTLLLT
jgi:hypothetical protein